MYVCEMEVWFGLIWFVLGCVALRAGDGSGQFDIGDW